MRGGLAALGARGGLAAIDTIETARPIEAFRLNAADGAVATMVGTAGARANPGTQFHVAGFRTWRYNGAGESGMAFRSANAMQSVGLGDWIFAMPVYFPQACTVTRLATKVSVNGANVDALFKLGLYDDVGAGNMFPRNKLAESAEFSADSGTTLSGMRVTAIETSIRTGTWAWFTITGHLALESANPSLLAIYPSCMDPVLGWTFNTADGNGWDYEGNTSDFGGGGLGWRIPRTYDSSLPSVMPETGAIRLNMNQASGSVATIPAVLYTVRGLR